MTRPNLVAFARKVRADARQRGVRPALHSAACEAGVWLYSRGVGARRDRPGRSIWSADWDLCVVVDAARWDQFCDVTGTGDPPLGGDISRFEAAWSVGSCSPEWYGNTFGPARLPADERIGVVTANPFAGKPPGRVPVLAGTPLDANPGVDYVDYVFEDSWGCEVDAGYLDVTHPAVVTDRAHAAWTERALDRLVVHYMQPHAPFRSRPEWFGVRDGLDRFGEPDFGIDRHPYQTDHKEIWKQLRDGDRDYDAVWTAYCDNLRWVLGEVDRLRRGLDPATTLLVTSDHGNGLGEWGIYGHPPGVHLPALREVPWGTVPGGGGAFATREVADYAPGDRTVDERLAALGYA